MKQLISSRDGNQVIGGWRKFTPPYIGLEHNNMLEKIDILNSNILVAQN